jgi:hypothetical protein
MSSGLLLLCKERSCRKERAATAVQCDPAATAGGLNMDSAYGAYTLRVVRVEPNAACKPQHWHPPLYHAAQPCNNSHSTA